MSPGRNVLLVACLSAIFFVACGIAYAAKNYPDPPGDVAGGSGPDIVSTQVSNTKAWITFRVRFVSTPPLRVGAHQTWVDMLLIAIDVPPLGRRPVAPGGVWPGADFALGTHGPSRTGQLVRLGKGIPAGSRLVATFAIVTRGATVEFSIPRRALGGPRWFTFSVAAAREMEERSGGGIDLAPADGTYRYTLT